MNNPVNECWLAHGNKGTVGAAAVVLSPVCAELVGRTLASLSVDGGLLV